MKSPNLFKTWKDFLIFKGLHTNRIKTLKDSLFKLGSPTNLRPLIWVALIDPEFSSSCLNFCRKSVLELSITTKTEKEIAKMLSHPIPSTLTEYFNIDSISRILKLFSLKRSDIGLSFGMHYTAAIFTSVFVVEVDAFIVFCYVYECLFPAVNDIQEFFYDNNRFIGLHQELRIFELMAEKMRPKLFYCLNAVYKEDSEKKSDNSPFVSLIKSIAQVWFRTLFTTMIPYKSVLRFFDVFLVFGMEFLHKFGLAYLSMKEKFLINSIKTETKGLNLGASVDGLIIAGNLTKLRLLQKSEDIKIENLIKKCLSKDTYKALNRFDYLSTAVILESKVTERINSIKKAKIQLKTSPFDTQAAISLIESFIKSFITRKDFTDATRTLAGWPATTSNPIFSLFDEAGDEQVDKLAISIGICLMAEATLDQRLELCFNVFDTDKSKFLSSTELLEMIMKIETVLDGRSSFYTRETESLMKVLDKNNDEKISLDEFVSTVKANRIFEPILHFLQIFDEDVEFIGNFELNYQEIHSPVSVSANVSDNSSVGVVDYSESIEKDLQFKENSEEGKGEKEDFDFIQNEEKLDLDVVQARLSKTIVNDDEPPISNETLPIDFPQSKKSSVKNRDCDRLCTRQACQIF